MDQNEPLIEEEKDEGQVEDEKGNLRSLPKYAFRPTLRGQGAFILACCEDKGLFAKYEYGKIRIFARKKFELFKEIIKQSYQEYKPREGLTYPVHIYRDNKMIMCIGVKSLDCLYTYERRMVDVVKGQFIGVIPTTKKIKIFNSQEEFNDYLRVRRII
jgi:hypothetical protein